MSTFSSTSQYGVLQRLAFAAGSALVNWAEQTARRSAASRPDPAVRMRGAQQRRRAEERRERTLAEVGLLPRQF